MNSDKSNYITASPFIRAFTLEILKNFKGISYAHKQIQRIDTSIIPKISEKILIPSILPEERIIPGAKIKPKPKKQVVPDIMPKRAERQLPFIRPKKSQEMQFARRPLIKPAPKNMKIPQEDYGKLTGLIKDPSITYVENLGAEKPIAIIRAGQRQLTKIILNEDEIKQFLGNVAAKARVPLVEGVFRAAVDNFSVNAVVSDLIGSRFIIKKQTPYSLLEKPAGIQGQGF